MCAKYFLLQVCLAAVGLVGDLSRAMNKEMLNYCDDIMTVLLENLGVCNIMMVLV